MTNPPRIQFCNCTYAQVVPPEVKAAVLQKLCESGVAFDAVADLCEMSARHDPALQQLADGGCVKIAGVLSARHQVVVCGGEGALAARLGGSIEHAGGSRRSRGRRAVQQGTQPEPAERQSHPGGRAATGHRNDLNAFMSLTNQTSLRVVLYEGDGAQPLEAQERFAAMTALLEPWFPVIDYDRSALLGGDIYSMLRQRSEQAKVRFSKERDEKAALQERKNCLVKLAGAGGIPAEVLMSLPSPDEILRRAEEARAKAQAALAAQPR